MEAEQTPKVKFNSQAVPRTGSMFDINISTQLGCISRLFNPNEGGPLKRPRIVIRVSGRHETCELENIRRVLGSKQPLICEVFGQPEVCPDEVTWNSRRDSSCEIAARDSSLRLAFMPEGSTGEKADNFTNHHVELLILLLFACGRFEPPWAEERSSRYDRDFRYFLCLFFLFFHYFPSVRL